jgi:hypothetical protein
MTLPALTAVANDTLGSRGDRNALTECDLQLIRKGTRLHITLQSNSERLFAESCLCKVRRWRIYHDHSRQWLFYRRQVYGVWVGDYAGLGGYISGSCVTNQRGEPGCLERSERGGLSQLHHQHAAGDAVWFCTVDTSYPGAQPSAGTSPSAFSARHNQLAERSLIHSRKTCSSPPRVPRMPPGEPPAATILSSARWSPSPSHHRRAPQVAAPVHPAPQAAAPRPAPQGAAPPPAPQGAATSSSSSGEQLLLQLLRRQLLLQVLRRQLLLQLLREQLLLQLLREVAPTSSSSSGGQLLQLSRRSKQLQRIGCRQHDAAGTDGCRERYAGSRGGRDTLADCDLC